MKHRDLPALPDTVSLLETVLFVTAAAVFLGVVFVLPLLSIARA